MITETMCAFMAQFEKEMSANGIENAIEIACSFDTQNQDYYEC